MRSGWVSAGVALGLGLLLGLALGAGFGRPWLARIWPGPPAGARVGVFDPEDPDQWVAFGERLESRDERARAERAYRTAAVQGDATGRAALRIGFMAYADGRDEEAELWLRQAQGHGLEPSLVAFTLAAIRARRQDEGSSGLTVPRVRSARPARPVRPVRPAAPASPSPPSATSQATPSPSPEPVPGPDAGVAPVAPTQPDRPCAWPLVQVGGGLGVQLELEGVATTLLYDTGASATLITADLARAVRAELDYRRVFRASTANGRVELPTAEFFDVALAGRQRDLGRVAVCEACLEGLEGIGGLFGLDLQRRFGVELNLADRELVFRDCEP